MRVVICGSSSWNFDMLVQDEIVKLHRWCRGRVVGKRSSSYTEGRRGPEEVAEKTCAELGIDRVIHPAIRACGQGAWPRRNQLMLQEHHVDLVLVFVYELKPDTMAHDMVSRARRRGVALKLIDRESISRNAPDDIEFNPFGGAY